MPAAPLATATVPSRAALAGNPSDGYGGAVVSVDVPAFAASVEIREHSGDEPVPLIATTLRRFSLDVAPVDGLTATFESTIPRSVGLAGSSAIVIATLAALGEATGSALEADQIAQLAHMVERVDLGIAGGWQDQIIQSRGGPLLMEFAEPMRQERLPSPIAPLFVAWTTEASEDSGVSHAELRARETEVAASMADLADVARSAAEALRAGSTHELKAAMNATFGLRRAVMPIDPLHGAMIDTARSLGAACNFAGSGGAIVGVVPKDAVAFEAGVQEAGLELTMWNPGDDGNG